MACRRSPSPAPVRRDATGSRSWCSPIRIATSSCSASIFRRSAAAWRTTVSTPSSRRIWSIGVRATRPGSRTTRACRCFLPKAAAPRSRWAARPPSSRASAGFVGVSDGWQDLSRHFELRWRYDHAPNGNVALTGEIDLNACAGSFVLALGFGRSAAEAALHVRASLNDGVDQALAGYAASWRAWQAALRPLDPQASSERPNTYRVSTAVLRTHEESSFAGGYIASLSIPWGFAKGDEDLGGYHLVWPRDLVETAGGLLAAGREERSAADHALPAGDSGSRRPLAAELLARRHALLERRADGRVRFSHPARRPRAGAKAPCRKRSCAGSGRW